MLSRQSVVFEITFDTSDIRMGSEVLNSERCDLGRNGIFLGRFQSDAMQGCGVPAGSLSA